MIATGGMPAAGGWTYTGGTIGTGGTTTGGTAGAGCTGTTTTGTALEEWNGSLCVAKLVTVGMGGTAFGIDATEVTRGQYASWLATNPMLPPTEDAACSWSTTFTPEATCMASGMVCQGTGCENHPQVCVDWCDAYNYCKGVGKRLCGKIGGGPNDYADYANAAMSQWYAACSSGGNAACSYPYCRTYEETTCNGSDYTWPAVNLSTTPVGSLSGCQPPAPYAGVYDLSGNAWEWEDSCDSTTTGKSAYCCLRGGSFNNGGSYYLPCGVRSYATRKSFPDYVGFRCCSL